MLKVGSTPNTVKDDLVPNRSISSNCLSLARTKLNYGAVRTSLKNIVGVPF